MKIRCIIGSAAFAASLTCSGAWAWDQDPAAQYFERKDTIVSGAGDALCRRPTNSRQRAADGGGCRTLSHEQAVGHTLSDCADI